MAEVEEFTERFSELRNNFLEKYSENIAQCMYDDRDVERVRSDDFYVKLFLKHTKGNYDISLEIMHDCLKFRKDFAVYDISEESFPQDLWESGGLYPHGVDKNGNHILWFIGRKYKKDPQRQLLTKRFLIYWLEKYSIEHPGERLVVLQDATQTGLQNMDLEIVKFIITSFKFYYPNMLAMMLIYEMPWILNAAWKIIQNWLSEEARKRVRFASKSNIQEIIGLDNLPPYMGGNDMYQWKYEPAPPKEYQETMEEEDGGTGETASSGSVDKTNGLPSAASNIERSDGVPLAASNVERSDDVPLAASNVDRGEESPVILGNGEVGTKPSTVRRRVHFADDTESPEKKDRPPLIKSCSADSIETLLSSSPPRKRETGGHGHQVVTPPRSRRHRRSSDASKGPLLTIIPGEELEFRGHQHNQEAQAVISLTNSTQGLIAFKVKTTAPEIFRVRPSAGPIAPGQAMDVQVHLQGGHEYTLRKEKFLVLSTQVQETVKSSVEVQALWKQVPSSSVIEHKLRCSYKVIPDQSQVKEPVKKVADLDTLQSQVTRLTSKLEQLVEHNRHIEDQLGSILKLLRFFLISGFILFLFGMYHYLQYSNSVPVNPVLMGVAEGQRSAVEETENILSDPSVRISLSGP